MENDQTRVNVICRGCGGSETTAAADARAIGLLDEFLAGTYTCCQVIEWADEQWLAWQEAGRQDGKVSEEITKPLEVEPDAQFDYVRVRKAKPGLPDQR